MSRLAGPRRATPAVGHRTKNSRDGRSVLVQFYLQAAFLAPGSHLGDVELQKVSRVGLVVLGAVVIARLGAAHHVAVGELAQPQVGGAGRAPVWRGIGNTENTL